MKPIRSFPNDAQVMTWACLPRWAAMAVRRERARRGIAPTPPTAADERVKRLKSLRVRRYEGPEVQGGPVHLCGPHARGAGIDPGLRWRPLVEEARCVFCPTSWALLDKIGDDE